MSRSLPQNHLDACPVDSPGLGVDLARHAGHSTGHCSTRPGIVHHAPDLRSIRHRVGKGYLHRRCSNLCLIVRCIIRLDSSFKYLRLIIVSISALLVVALVCIPAIVVVIWLTLVVLIIRIRISLMMAIAIIVMTLLWVSRHDCVLESPPTKLRSAEDRREFVVVPATDFEIEGFRLILGLKKGETHN